MNTIKEKLGLGHTKEERAAAEAERPVAGTVRHRRLPAPRWSADLPDASQEAERMGHVGPGVGTGMAGPGSGTYGPGQVRCCGDASGRKALTNSSIPVYFRPWAPNPSSNLGCPPCVVLVALGRQISDHSPAPPLITDDHDDRRTAPHPRSRARCA